MSNALTHASLRDHWTEAFGHAPPSRARADFMQRVLNWHQQMQSSEQWKGAAGLARLQRLLRGSTPSMVLSPGTRLLRDWQGSTHQVTVLDSGFEYAGKRFKSLSAVARTITGTAWSGPLFFGLKS